LENRGKYDLAGVVIGLAMKVHRALGPGFLESVYANALTIELAEARISFRRKAPLKVLYRNQFVGEFLCDFLIDGSLILELKSVSALNAAHEVQLVNYLTATGIDAGLLLNFGAASLEYKRRLRSLVPNSVNSVNSVQTSVPTAAFTLLELLVSMSVMAILAVLLLGIVDNTTKLWRTSESRVDSYREARAALSTMARDLSGTISSTNTNYFRINLGSGMPSGAETDTNRAGNLFFLAAIPSKAQDAGNKSDVCEVGYFLAWGRTSAVSGSGLNTNNASMQETLNLYRYFRSSDATFSNLVSTNALDASIVNITGQESELLARNVRSMKVTPLQQTNGAFVPFAASTSQPVPDLVEIEIRTLSQDAARRFTNKAAWMSGTAPAGLTNAEQSFTTRVRIPQTRQ